MPLKRLHAESRSGLLHLPEPNRAGDVATGEQAPMRVPGQQVDRTGMRQLPAGGAALGVPEPNSGIKSPTGEQAAIGGKSHTVDMVRMPACPEQDATLQIPQLDTAIPAPAGQGVSIRAEGKGPYHV